MVFDVRERDRCIELLCDLTRAGVLTESVRREWVDEYVLSEVEKSSGNWGVFDVLSIANGIFDFDPEVAFLSQCIAGGCANYIFQMAKLSNKKLKIEHESDSLWENPKGRQYFLKFTCNSRRYEFMLEQGEGEKFPRLRFLAIMNEIAKNEGLQERFIFIHSGDFENYGMVFAIPEILGILATKWGFELEGFC